MRVVYCDVCEDVSIKSRLERDVCRSCGRIGRAVPYSRPWQSYAGSGVLLAAAALLIVLPIDNLAIRLAVFGAGIAVALVLSSWSIAAIRRKILQAVARERREATEVES
jgi:F0F1-type ATP synthase membrane subunit c/vacuolar-type H+-ATPase subunit K